LSFTIDVRIAIDVKTMGIEREYNLKTRIHHVMNGM
jgi:hypothetical protein